MCLVCVMGDMDASSLQDLKDIEKSLCRLRELLTAALPDDLLDDDTASFSSHESSGSLSQRNDHHPPPSPSPDPWVHLRQQLPGHHKLIQQHQQLQQTSTPNGFSNPPPLKTPAPVSQHNGYKDPVNEQHFGHSETNSYDTNHIQNGQQFTESSDEETLGQHYERGEVEGAASDEMPIQRLSSETEPQFPGHGHIKGRGNQQRFRSDEYAHNHPDELDNIHGNHGYQEPGDHDDYQTANGMNGYQNEEDIHEYAPEDQLQNETSENRYAIPATENGDFEYQERMYDRQVQQYSPSHTHTQQYSPNHQQVTGNNQHTMHHGRNAPGQQTYMRDIHQADHNMNEKNPAIHRVQYRGDGAITTKPHPNEMIQHGSHVANQATVGFTQQGAGDQLQKQFLDIGGDEETRQMAQLQILYKARGRELDHLSNQLQVLKEESGREKRIMNHQLALAQGEKAGATASYDQCQQLLAEAQQENSNLKGQLQAAQVQIQALNAAKHEVEEKLQSTESAIDSLTGQLTELQRSQPLARAREQQDGLLKNLQERYEQELLRFKEKVDDSERTLEDKINEIANLRKELTRVARSADQAKLEQGNTINTLTNQLHHSQKQCRDLLETGSLQEINLLRVQLQEATAARSFSQDMTTALQEELSEMKEQLQMYESAMDLGVIAAAKSPESTNQIKSFAVRNLAKSDWRTPLSHGPSSDTTPNMTPDDLNQGLRKELERSLQSNRTKRGLVSKLQADLRASKTDMETLKKKLLEAETTAKDREVRFKVLEAQHETRKFSFSDDNTISQSQPSLRKLQEEIGKLQTQKEELSKMLEALRAEEGRLNEVNSDLKKQMAQMVTEWDQDKKIDLERVQKTCLQLHEDSSRHLREELVSEFQSERDMLKEAHQHQVQELRSDLEQAQKELVEVKGLYVDVCEEKNNIEDTVTKTLTAATAKQLETAKDAWQTQHDVILQELRESLESSHHAALVMAKNTWRQETEEENEKSVKEQVALAKMEWSEAVHKEAMKSAVKAADAQWKVKLEMELEQRLQQAEKDLEANHEGLLTKQREQLERDHKADKAKAIETALSKAKTEWMQTAEAGTKEKMKRAIEMAKEQWKDEDPDKRLEEAIAAARCQWTRERVDWTKVKEEWMWEHGENEIRKRVAERTKALEAKHLTDITNLQGVLENGRQKMKEEMEGEKLATLQDATVKIEREHQQALAEALGIARAEAEKDKSQSLERTSSKWQSRLDGIVKAQQDTINKAVEEAQDQWHKEKQEILEAQKKSLASLQAEAEADQEELRSQYETELERDIEEAVRSAREQWSQNCETELRKACDEILERKEQAWQQECNDLQEQLSDTTSQLQDSLRQAERHRKKHNLYRQKLEKEIESLKEQLQDADREMKQTEFNLRRELEQLQNRLKGANVAAIEALEAKMVNMQRRHEMELESARQQRHGQEQMMVDADTQTVLNNHDSVSSEALQELKAHYIRTVKKIKVDVMKRMDDMRENCRHTVHTEVMKERHNTAKKLRRYYLQCLQQFLEEDQNKTGNDNTKAQSTASKLAAMAKALELPPHQQATKSQFPVTSSQSAPSTSARSRENSISPVQSVCSDVSKGTDRNRISSPVADRKSTMEGKQQSLTRSYVPQATSAQVRHPHDFIKLADDMPVASHASHGGSGNDEGAASFDCRSADSSVVDRINSCQSSDELGSDSSGTSWEKLETGITLGNLPIQPREFNPKPERLPSNSHSKPTSILSTRTSSESLGNVTIRSRESSADNSVNGSRRGMMLGSSSSGRLYQTASRYEASLKSRESSPNCSPSDSNSKGQLKLKGKSSSSRPLKHDMMSVRSRESSPETSGSGSQGSKRLQTTNYPSNSKSSPNITVRSRRNAQPSAIGLDSGTSQQSPFIRPITDSKRGVEPRKGPVKVPPPTDKTAAMLASVPATIPRPLSQVARHTQIPSPGPYKATDTSTASLDTVYNDLPASLGTIQDYPSDLALDKVVRFNETARHVRGSASIKSKTEMENIRMKLSNVSSSRKISGVSTLPSRTTFGTKGPFLRSSDKLAYMLHQDSGFVSPQTDEQI